MVSELNKVEPGFAIGFREIDPVKTDLFSKINSAVAMAFLYLASFFSQSARRLLDVVKANQAFSAPGMTKHNAMEDFYKSLALAVDPSNDPQHVSYSVQALFWWSFPEEERNNALDRLDESDLNSLKIKSKECLERAENERSKDRKTSPNIEDLKGVAKRIHTNFLKYREALDRRVSNIWNLMFPEKDYDLQKSAVWVDLVSLKCIFKAPEA